MSRFPQVGNTETRAEASYVEERMLERSVSHLDLEDITPPTSPKRVVVSGFVGPSQVKADATV